MFLIRPNRIILAIMSIIIIHIFSCITPVPMFIQLMINSVSVVYISCFFSIKISKNKRIKQSNIFMTEKDEEILSKNEAFLFPIYGSILLFSLFLLNIYISENTISLFFTIYFAISAQICFMTSLEYFFTFSKKIIFSKEIEIDFIFYSKKIKIEISKKKIYSFIISLIPTILYTFTKNWILNNLFAIIFAIVAINYLIVIPNFKIGFILIWGLLFYDIFWVYGTDVMMVVAKSIDAPIKIMFPIDLNTTPPVFNMLGLGDIVVPGMLITFFAMIIFQHPQPALLFLVPMCSLCCLLYALLNSEIKNLFDYEDLSMRDEEENKLKEK